ncbi:type II toxin-antitoxin system VapC family toxin [Galactobacter sp.]|uniref:type II toxin-antitoxin system VapC family toxin n=1 Tax=Galactobacter sp. TaxID=2676125 RepID=UPI0025B7FC5C|nr:type II toxin-antitoxin system VapC family toxin [Galactobacter sp.]
MNYYVDTSIAVLALQASPRVVAWFDSLKANDALVSSRLLQTELTRFLRRTGRPVLDREVLLPLIGLVPLTDSVLLVAEAITEHTKSLDAIHLATALSTGGDIVVVSHDTNMLRVAELLGLPTLDPVSTS